MEPVPPFLNDMEHCALKHTHYRLLFILCIIYCDLLCEWGDKSELNIRRYQLLAPAKLILQRTLTPYGWIVTFVLN